MSIVGRAAPLPKANILAVAHRAGVAKSTVSRYLNGGSVSAELRGRLARTVEELGYIRSWRARGLKTGRLECIGVVVDSSHNPWFSKLLTGIQEEAAKRNNCLILASLDPGGRRRLRVVQQWIRERRVDGLLLVRLHGREERIMVNECMGAQLPTVVVGPDEPVPNMHFVRCDHRAAGVAAAYHLADLGHSRIAFAGGPLDSAPSNQRLEGLSYGLEARDGRLEPKWTFRCESYQPDAGCRFAEELLGTPLPFSALVIGDDALAIGFMRVARNRCIRIPNELSILGFDVPQTDLLSPPLTTVEQPVAEMGRASCRRLFEAISCPARRQVLVCETELITRGSMARPRRGRARINRVENNQDIGYGQRWPAQKDFCQA